jgi:hypothetical protein
MPADTGADITSGIAVNRELSSSESISIARCAGGPSMPVPDVVFVDAEPTPEEIWNARQARVEKASNALLKMQQTCGNCCHKCEKKCKALEQWLNLDEEKI